MTERPEKLMLIDSASMYYRAFYGVPDSVQAPDGTPVNAVRGFLDMLSRLQLLRIQFAHGDTFMEKVGLYLIQVPHVEFEWLLMVKIRIGVCKVRLNLTKPAHTHFRRCSLCKF